MRRFRFYAHGKNFDVDHYLSQYKIDYSRTWDKDKYEFSGLVKYLGNEYILHLDKQEKIAYEYMQKNKNALTAIANWENVDFAVLCLSCEYQVNSTGTETFFSFEPETMALAGEIGLRLAFDLEVSISEDWYIPFAEE